MNICKETCLGQRVYCVTLKLPVSVQRMTVMEKQEREKSGTGARTAKRRLRKAAVNRGTGRYPAEYGCHSAEFAWTQPSNKLRSHMIIQALVNLLDWTFLEDHQGSCFSQKPSSSQWPEYWQRSMLVLSYSATRDQVEVLGTY